ncbi:hypothetical protein E3N88_29681 [Mikania micrantha]|uniref:Uncharacterized protein n=1 Tax=Mikania micrantha TaxID=192012 RepID=A0A5N6MK36_9ASTR|nr:hypothetical protein E3N88_29681 [Mikania micrantha]
MTTISKHDTENGTLNKPPMFTPDDYDTWKMYEGSEDVKENKKDMLKQKFENVCQENNEKMASQYLRTENLRTLKPGELFGILSAYQMEIDAQEPKSTSVPSSSAALYAPIHNPPFQNYHPIYHSNSTPIITFPETPTLSISHLNPFASSTPLLTSSQGAFMAEETNYFHLYQEDLDGISADDLEEMDINYQMTMISYRAKKFYQRTGRQFRKHNMKTGANIAEQHDFSDWNVQAEEASTSNNALMANDSTSTFKVTNDMCTPECLEKLNAYKRFNAQVCDELESIQVVKANFFEAKRNYKEKIEELEKTISSLKHEDTNKQYLTALTVNPVVYESHHQQFWGSCSVVDSQTGRRLSATIDTHPISISVETVCRHLNLNDVAGSVSFTRDEWIA